MSAKVTVEIDADVFERLKTIAEPLVDTVGSVVRRILDQWELLKATADETSKTVPQVAAQTSTASTKSVGRSFFRTSRGVQLPFGKLRASYRRRGGSRMVFEAQVTARGIEFDGQVFDNPSPAGEHAKERAGARGKAASTNGWEFWELFDEKSRSWISIDQFRQSTKSVF